MSNNFLIVTCEDHVNYQYFAKFKKLVWNADVSILLIIMKS
jgi:hypothetical protein